MTEPNLRPNHTDSTLQLSDTTSLTWTTWLTTPALAATFTGLPGQSYAFRLRAVDSLGNPSDWTAPATTTIAAVTKYYALGGQKIAMRQGGVVRKRCSTATTWAAPP